MTVDKMMMVLVDNPPLGMLPPLVVREYELRGMPATLPLLNKLFRFEFIVLAWEDEGSTLVDIWALIMAEPEAMLKIRIFEIFVWAAVSKRLSRAR